MLIQFYYIILKSCYFPLHLYGFLKKGGIRMLISKSDNLYGKVFFLIRP